MPTSKSSLTFFCLPAELKNAIYEYVLVEERPVELPYAYEYPSFEEPTLLTTSRAIRAEAAPIYYGCNIFEAPSPASAHRFLSRLDRECIAQLRDFRPCSLVLPVSAHQRWFDALRVNVTRLVRECGKGVLRSEAISVPMRGEDGSVAWLRLGDVECLEVVQDKDGVWAVESRHKG